MSKRVGKSLVVLAVAVTVCAIGRSAWANVVLTNTVPYQQSFDNLASSGNNNTWTNNQGTTDTHGMPGWYWQESENASLLYDVTTGTASTGSAYSLGVAGVNAITDRTMGNLGSGAHPNTAWGVVFQNNNSLPINTIKVDYTGEEWKRSNSETGLTFSYIVSATDITGLNPGGGGVPTGWIGVSSLDFAPPVVGSGMSLDGNDPANRTAKSATIFVNVPVGEYFALRWYDADDTNNDGITAVDNVTVTVTVPEPTAFLFGSVVCCVVGIATAARKQWRKVKPAA